MNGNKGKGPASLKKVGPKNEEGTIKTNGKKESSNNYEALNMINEEGEIPMDNHLISLEKKHN